MRRFATNGVILEIHDAIAEAMRTGIPYQDCLDPQAAYPLGDRA